MAPGLGLDTLDCAFWSGSVYLSSSTSYYYSLGD
jgi:hypothetical protein